MEHTFFKVEQWNNPYTTRVKIKKGVVIRHPLFPLKNPLHRYIFAESLDWQGLQPKSNPLQTRYIFIGVAGFFANSRYIFFKYSGQTPLFYRYDISGKG